MNLQDLNEDVARMERVLVMVKGILTELAPAKAPYEAPRAIAVKPKVVRHNGALTIKETTAKLLKGRALHTKVLVDGVVATGFKRSSVMTTIAAMRRAGKVKSKGTNGSQIWSIR